MKIRIDPREGSEFDKAEMSPMIWWQREIKRDSSHLKGLCQLESMRSEVMQITSNCQNSIVFKVAP